MSRFLLLIVIPFSLVSLDAHGKTIIVLMDGTWNEPEFEKDGKFPQGDATNVEKLRHLLSDDEQEVQYHLGIGTDGKRPRRVKDGAFGSTAKQRVTEAYDELADSYEQGDELAIFGFSRGAATARMLARRIAEQGLNGNKASIKFLGLWDTVASLGVPLPKLDEFRKRYHETEDLSIPTAVMHVVHLVAIDEDRSLFSPSLIMLDPPGNSETTIDELWFAGNHGDVGGGWTKETQQERLLSDITLEYMVRQAKLRGIHFNTDWRSELRLPENGGGRVHSLGRLEATKLFSGRPEVRELASAGSDKPRLHRSVANKFQADSSYRPEQFSSELDEAEIVD